MNTEVKKKSMTQEQKELLLNDLCARLPYGIKVEISCIESPLTVLSINTNGVAWVKGDKGYPFDIDWEYCKPYLFPLSSMTEEQRKEYDSIIYHNVELHADRYYEVIDVDSFEELHDFYHKNHFDYRGLIPMGLAIDATGLNIY